jgi:hypothetical protein
VTNTTMKRTPTNKEVLAAFRYFNPYFWDGDICNPWSSLLADYKRKRDNPSAVYHLDAVRAGTFRTWLVAEAMTSEFELIHDL